MPVSSGMRSGLSFVGLDSFRFEAIPYRPLGVLGQDSFCNSNVLEGQTDGRTDYTKLLGAIPLSGATK